MPGPVMLGCGAVDETFVVVGPLDGEAVPLPCGEAASFGEGGRRAGHPEHGRLLVGLALAGHWPLMSRSYAAGSVSRRRIASAWGRASRSSRVVGGSGTVSPCMIAS